MLLYGPITSIADYALLQQDIDSISDWVDKNYLQFNIQKWERPNAVNLLHT